MRRQSKSGLNKSKQNLRRRINEPNWLKDEMEADFLSAVLETAGMLVIVLDCEGRIVRFNRACEQITQYSFEEVRGQHFWDIFLIPEEIEPVKAVFHSLRSGHFPNQFENFWLTKDGERRLITWNNTALLGTDGSVQWIIGIGVDVTERMRAEEALKESEERFAGIVSHAREAIISVDESQRIILFNEQAEKIFGYSAEEVIGKPLDILIPPRFTKSHREHIREFSASPISGRGMNERGDIYGIRKDGREFPAEASISKVELRSGKLFTVMLRDITERKQAEERLREQATLLDRAKDAILVRDLSDTVLFWSKGAERLYGWTSDEAVGKNIRELLYTKGDPPPFEQAHKVLAEKGEWMGELRQMTKDGKELTVESRWTLVRNDKGEPKSILVINTDITEKKKLEAQFLRAQRMESIGTLAGGIAHDLNNVLSPILMSIRMLQMRFTDESSQRLLATLRASAERGARMVSQVLSFARGAEGERIAVQPRHLIREIVKILKDTLPKTIDIRFSLPDNLWAVAGDPTQLYQVLMNLCVNARDAMPQGGRLTIETENAYIDETYARMHLDAKPGRFVVITVSDTGVGIPPHIIDKIFEPFFTTKGQGEGTGLGLSTVMGIVRGHGGFINAYSEVGKGTQFKVYLPAIESTEMAQRQEEQGDLPVGHGELILVVDDEEAILEITRGTLEAFGYNVLTASDGTEAVALYAQNKDKIQVVLVDMMMPYMDGPSTIRALQKLNPKVKIIAASGLAANGKAVEAIGAAVKIFLSKPYTADKLLTALAGILKPRPRDGRPTLDG